MPDVSYKFSSAEASKYGVNEAIFIECLRFWLVKNRANGKHFYDGRTWTYNSRRALAEMFPFWTEKQVRTITEKLKRAGVLVSGNYNTNPYDRTAWYAFADEEKFLPARDKSICENAQMNLPNRANENARSGRPIPVILPVNNPPYNPPLGGQSAEADVSAVSQNSQKTKKAGISTSAEFDTFWNAYPRNCPRKTGKAQCWKFWKQNNLDSLLPAVIDALNAWKSCADWTKEGGKFICAPLVWLHKQAWLDGETAPSCDKNGSQGGFDVKSDRKPELDKWSFFSAKIRGFVIGGLKPHDEEIRICEEIADKYPDENLPRWNAERKEFVRHV